MDMSAPMNAARRVAAHNEAVRAQDAAQTGARMGGGIWPGSDEDDDMRPALLATAYVLAAAAITLIALAIMGWVWVNTGPNCPGTDPAWIGWCSDAPGVLQ